MYVLKEILPRCGYLINLVAFSFLSIYGCGYGIKPQYLITVFLLLFLTRCRFFHTVLILFFSLFPVIYFPVGSIVGPINYNIVVSVFHTNNNEAYDFLLGIPFKNYIPSFLLLISAGLLIKQFKTRNYSISKKLRYVLSLAVIVIIGSSLLKSLNFSGKTSSGEVEEFFVATKIHFTPVRPWIKIYSEYTATKKFLTFYNENVKKPDNWNPSKADKPIDTVLVFIGESVKREKMSLYGYKMDTTPFLRTLPGTVFTNYTSAGPATVLSLTHTLFNFNRDKNNPKSSGSIEYQNSIVRLIKKGGYKTHWISNQDFLGSHDSPIAVGAQQADSAFFIRSGIKSKSEIIDTALAPYVIEKIHEPGPKVIFVHLAGSHPNACTRTNGEYKQFHRSKDVSCYLQSIINDDNLMRDTVEELKKTTQSWGFVYISDHALSVIEMGEKDERYVHGDKYRNNYHVPFFVATNKDKEQRVNAMPRTGFQFMGMIAQLLNISEPKIDLPCQFLTDDVCVNDRDVINSAGKLMKYDELTMQKDDDANNPN